MEKEILINHLNEIHTTLLGITRIKTNLNIEEDPIKFTTRIILNDNSKVEKRGKNYYVYFENIVITINSYSYTIITAKKERNKI